MIAAGASLYLDRLIGEPGNSLHPVAGFGRVMQGYEIYGWRDTRGSGLQYCTLGLALAYLSSKLMSRPFLGTLVSSYLVVAERSLHSHASRIAQSLEAGNLCSAREVLPALVGRDVSGLDMEQCSRAVVESVAENSSDAVIAPMFYGSLFGSAGAFVYRAINTMDAMVGYKSARYRKFGWASARLDDVANWVPARIAALLVLVAAPFSTEDNHSWHLSQIAADAKEHPSPNAGVVEAAFAHKLGVKLGGTNHYLGVGEVRTDMGVGELPKVGDISRAIALCRKIDQYFSASLMLVGVGLFLSGRRK